MRWAREFHRSKPPIHLRKGIAILPSLFTVINMLCGYTAVISASRGDFELAVTLIILAGFLDAVDGRVARLTNTTSEFGVELDSLTDFLSFGVAPALVLFHWGFSGPAQPEWLARTGWLFPFLLPVAGAIRLARFNVEARITDHRNFTGLPIPMAAAAAVLPLYYLPRDLPDGLKLAALGYVVMLAWFMVSRMKWKSGKSIDGERSSSTFTVFLLAILVIVVAFRPKPVLLTMALVYVAYGPAIWIVDRIRSLRRRSAP